MMNQWRLLCNILWPEPAVHSFPLFQPGIYKNTYYILPYKNSIAKTAIRNNKFHYHKVSALYLAEVIDTVLEKYNNLTIIPIPSSSARLRSRGFEHLLHILELSKYNDRVQTEIVRKKVHTKPQSHVNKKTRLRQQTNTFICNTKAAMQLTGTIILFDDVVTTEATMAAARASLDPHLASGTKLICLAIAH
mgnify:CR=1 FL=1